MSYVFWWWDVNYFLILLASLKKDADLLEYFPVACEYTV